MDDRYDIIIIGAGPAGLALAETLKNTHLTVLLTEKNSVIGPKICAGGITSPKERFDVLPEKMLSFENHKVFLGSDSHEIVLENPIGTINRLDLGHYQMERIKDSKNITLLKGTSAHSIDGESVTTDRGVFRYRHLVGADGSASLVRRHLGLGRKVAIGLCCEVARVREGFVWYVNPRKLGTSYIWEFPHRDHTNVGIYFDPEHLSPGRARKFLIDYLGSNDYEVSPEDIRGAPVNYDYRGCVFGNIFLAGDAAGLASKPSGEGISHALISGKEIGRKILDPAYEMRELQRILKLKKRQENILRVFELFPFMQKTLFKVSINLVKQRRIQAYFGN